MSKELTPLEAVKCLKEQFEICGIKNNPYLKIIEKALKDYEYLKTELLGQSQELNVKNKTLEIIKDKRCDIYLLMECEKLEHYNENDYLSSDQVLTPEEFDLLKEVLQ